MGFYSESVKYFKKCASCETEKPLEDFHRNRSTADGASAYCKECVKQRSREYYLKNKEVISEKGRRYREKKSEEIADYRRKYYQENKDKFAESRRDYARRNRKKIKAYHRDYHERNREKLLEQKRRYHQENKERFAEGRKEYARRNREKNAIYHRDYRERNREKLRAQKREYYQKNKPLLVQNKKEYNAKNRDKAAERNRRYRQRHPHKANPKTRIANSLHPKHDDTLGGRFYALAKRLGRMTGEKWHVDHVVPLACGGWHHHENLQVIPARWNCQKRHDPTWCPDPTPPWFHVPTEGDLASGGVSGSLPNLQFENDEIPSEGTT